VFGVMTTDAWTDVVSAVSGPGTFIYFVLLMLLLGFFVASLLSAVIGGTLANSDLSDTAPADPPESPDKSGLASPAADAVASPLSPTALSPGIAISPVGPGSPKLAAVSPSGSMPSAQRRPRFKHTQSAGAASAAMSPSVRLSGKRRTPQRAQTFTGRAHAAASTAPAPTRSERIVATLKRTIIRGLYGRGLRCRRSVVDARV
jgi:hypothetical protein